MTYTTRISLYALQALSHGLALFNSTLAYKTAAALIKGSTYDSDGLGEAHVKARD